MGVEEKSEPRVLRVYVCRICNTMTMTASLTPTMTKTASLTPTMTMIALSASIVTASLASNATTSSVFLSVTCLILRRLEACPPCRKMLQANRTLHTQIMSKPGEVGPPISSLIPACLLPGQPSRRRGPPLAQGGQKNTGMIWQCHRCCPNESLVALSGQSAKRSCWIHQVGCIVQHFEGP